MLARRYRRLAHKHADRALANRDLANLYEEKAASCLPEIGFADLPDDENDSGPLF